MLVLARPQVGQIQLSPGTNKILAQMKVKYDPDNGYFDYIQAAMVLQEKKYWLYELAMTPNGLSGYLETTSKNAEGEEEAQQKAEIREFAKLIGTKRPLEVKRMAMHEFRAVFPLVEAARKKAVRDPRDPATLDQDTLFPEYSYFRTIAKFLTLVAVDVDQADGRPIIATNHIVDCFRISEALTTSPTLIAALVGRTVHAVALASIERNLARLTLPECEALDRYAGWFLSQESALGKSVRADSRWILTFVDKLFQLDPKTIDPKNGMVPESLLTAIQKVPVTARPGYAAKVKAKLEAQVKEVVDLLAKDERAWVAYLDQKELPRPGDAGQERFLDANHDAPLEDRVVDTIGGSYEMVVQPLFMQQTQMRLLRVCCAVIQFKWMNGVYPASLKQAGPAEMMTDRVTGQPYRYRITGSDFEVIAQGSKSLGDIKLRWRKAATESGTPPPAPGLTASSSRPS